MPTKPTSADEYIAALPEADAEMVTALLTTIRKNLDKKFEEGLQYGMPAFYLPHSAYPNGYHCDPKQPLPFASVASRKSGASIYLFGIYCDPEQQEKLRDAWKATGKRLDMGKSCIRVKKLDQVPLDVLGAAVKRMTAAKFVKSYEASVPAAKRSPAKKPSKKPSKKPAKKAAKKTVKKTVKKAAKKTR